VLFVKIVLGMYFFAVLGMYLFVVLRMYLFVVLRMYLFVLGMYLFVVLGMYLFVVLFLSLVLDNWSVYGTYISWLFYCRLIALMSPEDSWVAKWQRISKLLYNYNYV